MSTPARYITGVIRQKVVELHDKLEEEGKPVPAKIQAVYDCITKDVKTCDQDTLFLAVKELQEAGYFKLPGHDLNEKLSKVF